jgi:hypothetical protein
MAIDWSIREEPYPASIVATIGLAATRYGYPRIPGEHSLNMTNGFHLEREERTFTASWNIPPPEGGGRRLRNAQPARVSKPA